MPGDAAGRGSRTVAAGSIFTSAWHGNTKTCAFVQTRSNAQVRQHKRCSKLHISQKASPFDEHKAVTQSSENEYFLVTGQHTHYLLAEPSVPDCLHHEWGKSNAAGVGAPPGPITVSNVKERSFFPSGETHHCAHGNVLLAKSSEITAENRARCGPRSGDCGSAK